MSRGFISDNLRDLLEELRIRMHMDMTEEMGIPRLDPFHIEELDLEPILNELVYFDFNLIPHMDKTFLNVVSSYK